MDSFKDAMLKGFEPEFTLTLESMDGDRRGLKVLSTIIESRIRGAYQCVPDEQEERVVLYVRRNQ